MSGFSCMDANWASNLSPPRTSVARRPVNRPSWWKYITSIRSKFIVIWAVQMDTSGLEQSVLSYLLSECHRLRGQLSSRRENKSSSTDLNTEMNYIGKSLLNRIAVLPYSMYVSLY